MIITEIKPKKRHANAYEIFCDNIYAGDLYDEVVYQFHLQQNNEITSETLAEALLASDNKFAFNYSLNLVSRGFYSQKQISQKLSQKGYKPKSCELAISKLKEYGYLNDKEFATAYVQQNQQSKGKLRLANELKQKGISDDLISKSLPTADFEREQALKLCQKYNEKHPISDQKNKEKLIRSLLYKGYVWEIISYCLNNLKVSIDEYEE